MIAIVDDDESMREATRRLLMSFGITAGAFASAEEFMQSDRVNDTSCVITDVRMPGMGGVELQSFLIAKGYRTPIIFITAYPEDRVRERVLKAGAVGFLSKPFDEECLIKCVDTALNGQREGERRAIVFC